MKWNTLFSNASITFAMLLAMLAESILIFCSFYISGSRDDIVINLAIISLGYAIGSVIGTALSPHPFEREQFSSYGKAVGLFFSGYVTSKLDGAINFLFLPSTLTTISSMSAFRSISFLATIFLVAKVTFAFRSYSGPDSNQNSN